MESAAEISTPQRLNDQLEHSVASLMEKILIWKLRTIMNTTSRNYLRVIFGLAKTDELMT